MKKIFTQPEIEAVKLIAMEEVANQAGNPSMNGGHDEYDPWG